MIALKKAYSDVVRHGAEKATISAVYESDDPAIARLRAVEDLGGPQWFAILGGTAALLPFVVVHPANAAYVVALAFAGAGALGFAPALATACEMLVPRRRSVEELYGRR